MVVAAAVAIKSLEQIEPDNYKGIIVKDMNLLKQTEQEFDEQLSSCLRNWEETGKVRSV